MVASGERLGRESGENGGVSTASRSFAVFPTLSWRFAQEFFTEPV
jgi:hypothetical protein